MATIKLYTTSLEHQHTQDIAWRGTKYINDPHMIRIPVTTVRVDRIDQTTSDIAIAQVVETCGDAKVYAVHTILTRRYAQDTDTGQPVAEPEQTTEYELTPLSDDAARIINAVTTKQRETSTLIGYQLRGVAGPFINSERWKNIGLAR